MFADPKLANTAQSQTNFFDFWKSKFPGNLLQGWKFAHLISEQITCFCPKMSKWAIRSKKWAIHSFAHFWWVTWAIRSWSLISSERPERITHCWAIVRKKGENPIWLGLPTAYSYHSDCILLRMLWAQLFNSLYQRRTADDDHGYISIISWYRWCWQRYSAKNLQQLVGTM